MNWLRSLYPVLLTCSLASAITIQDVMAQQKPLDSFYKNVSFSFKTSVNSETTASGSIQIADEGSVTRNVVISKDRGTGKPYPLNFTYVKSARSILVILNVPYEYMYDNGAPTAQTASKEEDLLAFAPENIREIVGDNFKKCDFPTMTWTVSEPVGDEIAVECMAPKPGAWSGRRWHLDITKNMRVKRAESLGNDLKPYIWTEIEYGPDDYPKSIETVRATGEVATTLLTDWESIAEVDLDVVHYVKEGENLVQEYADGSKMVFEKREGELHPSDMIKSQEKPTRPVTDKLDISSRTAAATGPATSATPRASAVNPTGVQSVAVENKISHGKFTLILAASAVGVLVCFIVWSFKGRVEK